jgi:hypothetical protein
MLRLVLSGPILKYPKGHWACAVEEIIVAIKAIRARDTFLPQTFRFKNLHNPRNERLDTL